MSTMRVCLQYVYVYIKCMLISVSLENYHYIVFGRFNVQISVNDTTVVAMYACKK